MNVPLYVAIARRLQQRANLLNREDASSDGFLQECDAALESMARDGLPSGSGFDNGTSIDLQRSNPCRVVLETSFHHMDENGFYDGWTDHDVVIRPSLVHGFDLRVTGRDRNDVKGYIGEAFDDALHDSWDTNGRV